MRSALRMGVVVVLSGILGSAQRTSIDWDAYIDHIVNLLEENSILRYEIDWDAFRAQVEKIAKPSNLETESERLEVVRRMFDLLEVHCDVHSGLVLPGIVEENQTAWADGRTPHTRARTSRISTISTLGCSREGWRTS
jgi:hypothetical protein